MLFGILAYMRTYTPPDFTPIPPEATCVFEGVIHDVYQWQQEQFDGSYTTFELLKRPDTVITIPVVGDELLLSQETQPHLGSFLNFPGGRHEHPEDDELAAAKRELREETGYEFKTWKLLNAYQPLGHFSYITYIFLATDVLRVGEQSLDAGEQIEVVKMDFDSYTKMKHDPQLRSYHDEIFDDLHSIDELLALPSLYDYGV